MEEDKLLTLKEVLKRVPVARSSWLGGVRQGKFPKSVKLGERLTFWKKSDIDKLIAEGCQTKEEKEKNEIIGLTLKIARNNKKSKPN